MPRILLIALHAINENMMLKSDLEDYLNRWVEVAAFQKEERRTASIALRSHRVDSS